MTTKVITVTPALRAIQRKLEQLELTHLREFISQQAAVIDSLKEQAHAADENAEYWRDSWFDMAEELASETDSVIGLAKTGEVGLIAAPQAQPVVAIGEQWPGTNAIYAGISLSSDETRAVHLIVWPERDSDEHNHAAATAAAEEISPEHASHLPTRIQAITLFKNLKAQFAQTWYWTSTKTESGKAAFFQNFRLGTQLSYGLSAECRVRAVSEIQL